MLDLYPVIENKVKEMILNNINKLDILDYISGQVLVYSISKDEGNYLKSLIK